jgi:putative membrane protein
MGPRMTFCSQKRHEGRRNRQTPYDAAMAPSQRNPVPLALLAVYVVLFVVCGIAPHSRAVWWAENIPIVAIAVTLVVLYARGVRFSSLAYALMSVLLFLHTIGGHYTFERVPFDWFSNAFGFERNHYDRIAHFSVGCYAFGMAEGLIEHKLVARPWIAYCFGIFAIGTVAATYEIIEWIYAAAAGGDSGAAFLGSQGDIWDAQKDMLADISGALCATALLAIRGRRRCTVPPHGPGVQ